MITIQHSLSKSFYILSSLFCILTFFARKFLNIYKWANSKNCTKLPYQFQYFIQRHSISNMLIQAGYLFFSDFALKILLSLFKNTVCSIICTAHIMYQRHDQPITLNPLLWPNLVFIKCKFVLALSKKDLNWPYADILKMPINASKKCI